MKQYEDLVKLVKRVQATGGMDTDEASVCDYQDMIGHSSDEQLRELANGEMKHAFYRIYGCAYGTISAIQFFTKHSNKLDEIIHERDEAICDRDDAREDLKKEKEKTEKAFAQAQKMRDSWEQEKTEKENIKRDLEKAQAEIIQLKAKLYDLIMNK